MGVGDVGGCVMCVICVHGLRQEQIYRCVSWLQREDINKAEGRKLSIEHNQVDPLECHSSHIYTHTHEWR